jgi:sugar phosphate isomerase/epimerase
MRIGVFTPLLSQLPLPDVLRKLAQLDIRTVELATGNYPGDAHCSPALLQSKAALREFRSLLTTMDFRSAH